MAIKMAAPLLRARPVSGGLICTLAFVAVGLLRLPLPWVMLGLAPLSIAIAWRVGR